MTQPRRYCGQGDAVREQVRGVRVAESVQTAVLNAALPKPTDDHLGNEVRPMMATVWFAKDQIEVLAVGAEKSAVFLLLPPKP
jgi:hypothetical protein